MCMWLQSLSLHVIWKVLQYVLETWEDSNIGTSSEFSLAWDVSEDVCGSSDSDTDLRIVWLITLLTTILKLKFTKTIMGLYYTLQKIYDVRLWLSAIIEICSIHVSHMSGRYDDKKIGI